ncbi:hypothetical protein EX30DRAFT_212933 [Ascodesmis nigricans]|uniref:DUF8035 domain-containing protein n=1 Tax=Ascodesmis nigricans TaxID=341454 RepID=A0A4S2MZ01_9PEZI|nr:hypothetical protein EX30DRAFT_212933 [Ascodesmis nigricans]
MAPPTTKIRAAPPSAFHQQLDPRFSSHSLQPNSLHRRRGSSSSGSDIDGWGYSPRSSWSPSTAATSISGSSHVPRGRRRASSFTSPPNSRPILVNHDVRARSPQHPMVFQQTTRDRSPMHRSGRTIVMPGSSIKSGRRGSLSSRGGSEYSKSIYGSSPPRSAYHGNYNYARREMSRRHEGDFDAPRKGRTKFPLRLVAEEAVDRMRYPYTIEENGSIVVLQALRRPEIDELIDMTAQLRRESTSPRIAHARSRAQSVSTRSGGLPHHPAIVTTTALDHDITRGLAGLSLGHGRAPTPGLARRSHSTRRH